MSTMYKIVKMKKFILMDAFLFCLFSFHSLQAQKLSENIKLNQVGYYTHGPKNAILTGSVNEKYFYITSTNLRDTFFTGNLTQSKSSAYSTTKTQLADFSSFQKKGTYVLLINNLGHSYVFTIGDDVLSNTLNASLKGFYYQRASMPLEEKYAGKWARGAGHPDNKVSIHPSAASKVRPAGFITSSAGGWYDAGDYNKYIVNSGITMGTLLSAYEDFPEASKSVKPSIPYDKNGVPAIIEEAVYNLRWMLTMQDPNDGGVYTKCTNASFDGMILPGITTLPRYLVQKSTAASLDFVAVTAQAGRILKKFKAQYPGLADSCVSAAKKAWGWALVNNNLAYDQDGNNKKFTPAITTGGYGDGHFEDEWLWAASEMYSLNADNEYLAIIKANQKLAKIEVPSWGTVTMLAYYTLIRNKNTATLSATAEMKKEVLAMAESFLKNQNQNAFNTIMGQQASDFVWGSNAVAANQGILLINAYLISKNKKYVDAALSNVDYLLGRNATGYCFITGSGSKSPMHPHHRPSIADGITEPVPGLLVGGPNPGKQDGCVYEFSETETAYTDVDCSYASNEIAINWNAPLVYLLNAVQALKQSAGYVKK